MGIFKKDTESALSGLPLQELIEIHNNDVVVSENNILRIPTVSRCLNTITNDVASLEVKLYQNKNGAITEVKQHELLNILNKNCNNFMTSYNFKKNISKDLILYGRAYGEIQDNELFYNKAYNYNFLKEYDKNGNINGLNIQIAKENGVYNLPIEKLLPFNYDSLDITNGKGILNSDLILKLGLHELQYSNSYMKNGGFISKILYSKTPFKKETKDKLKQDLAKLHGGSSNTGKMMVLEGDIDLKSINNPNAKEMELVENRKFSTIEICSLFNINPLYLNGEKSKDLQTQYINQALNPILTVMEQGFNELLSLREINDGYYFEFDTQGLFKADDITLAEMATTLYNNGISTKNEARKIVGLESKEDDNIKLSLGNVLQTENGEILNFNMNTKEQI